MIIGVISDTHGYLPDAVTRKFKGVDCIIHAGDAGEHVLTALKEIAPLTVVRGNMDDATVDGFLLAETEYLEKDAACIIVMHILKLGNIHFDMLRTGLRLVISGHTHIPAFFFQDGIWFLNPGSAHSGRQGHTASAALLTLNGNEPPSVEFLPV